MKKLTKTTKAPQRPLAQQDLAAVLGGTGGTIISENIVGGTGKISSDRIIVCQADGISEG